MLHIGNFAGEFAQTARPYWTRGLNAIIIYLQHWKTWAEVLKTIFEYLHGRGWETPITEPTIREHVEKFASKLWSDGGLLDRLLGSNFI